MPHPCACRRRSKWRANRSSVAPVVLIARRFNARCVGGDRTFAEPAALPIRQRRAELAADPARLHDVLNRGNTRANEIDERTLDQVGYVTDLAC